MGAVRWLLLLTASGCSYPEFNFGAQDAARADSADVDTGAPELADSTLVEDTAPLADSEASETPSDTFMPDTFVADTAMPDAFLPDTIVDTSKPDAPVSTGCTGIMVDFCSDWDKVAMPAADFSSFTVEPTSSLTLDVGGGRSSPNAMLAQTSPSTTDNVVRAYATKAFTAPSADAPMRADVWLKLETATFPGSSAFLFKIQRGDGGGQGVTFNISKDGYFVARVSTVYERYNIASPKPQAGVWTHIRVETRLHSTLGTLTAWIDDMSTPAFSKSGISTVVSESTPRQFLVGAYAQDTTATFKVRYDDVTFDFK